MCTSEVQPACLVLLQLWGERHVGWWAQSETLTVGFFSTEISGTTNWIMQQLSLQDSHFYICTWFTSHWAWKLKEHVASIGPDLQYLQDDLCVACIWASSAWIRVLIPSSYKVWCYSSLTLSRWYYTEQICKWIVTLKYYFSLRAAALNFIQYRLLERRLSVVVHVLRKMNRTKWKSCQ